MAITVGGSVITFNDGTTQSTAATGGSPVPSSSTAVGAIVCGTPTTSTPTPSLFQYTRNDYPNGTTIAGSSLAYDIYLYVTGAGVAGIYKFGRIYAGYGLYAYVNGLNPGVGAAVSAAGITGSSFPAANSSTYTNTTIQYSTGLSGTWRAVAGCWNGSYYASGKGGNTSYSTWINGFWQRIS